MSSSQRSSTVFSATSLAPLVLTPRQRQALAGLLLTSGSVGVVRFIRRALRDAVREQTALCASAEILDGGGSSAHGGVARRRGGKAVAVDARWVLIGSAKVSREP